MKLTVITPSFNDGFFVKAWFANVSKFSQEIVIADTGSTDGSLEFFQKQSNVKLITNFKTSHRFDWNESEIRNAMILTATGDIILALDLDELVGNEIASVLTDFSRSSYKIARLTEYKFWGDLRHLRKRSLKPAIRSGKIGWLSNWRGAYPNRRPQLFKNTSGVYYKGKIHPVLQYKDYGRLSFYLPGVCKDYNTGVYHYHFAFDPKIGEDRYMDRFDKVKLVEFKGRHPEEINLFGESL